MAKKPATDAPDGAPLAPPCAMVIFGAAGDLTKRLVVPALYNLVNAQRLPDEFRIVGVDLASKTTEEWRKGLTETMQGFVGSDGEFAVDQIDQTAWRWLTDRMSYLQGDLTNAETLPPARRASRRTRQDGRHGGQPPLLSRRRRSLLQRGGCRSRGGGSGDGKRRTMAPGRDREAVRPRSDLGQGAQRRDPEDAAGASDLPDRSFPRQGNGAEHHGAALRQRPVRADVEPRAHRPRPDHRGRDRRRRAPRQVLREDRRAARHGAQPRLPAAVA